jgi:hypothetical protein
MMSQIDFTKADSDCVEAMVLGDLFFGVAVFLALGINVSVLRVQIPLSCISGDRSQFPEAIIHALV